MAFVPKKPLLYADLFKNDHEYRSFSSSSSSSSSLNSSSQSLLCDSSSSGFSTPPDSGSLESEDGGNFIAELTRQMAECMLQEEEDSKNYGCEVTELGIQRPAVTKQGHIGRGRRARGKKLSQHQKKLLQKADQNYTTNTAAVGHTGSGMKAVFIGPGSGYGSAGTGVFLPRTAGVNAGLPTAGKKKSGCSMVLMPTRVLQVLELHFNRLQDEGWRSRQGQLGNGAGNEEEKMQLPQEWTY